MKKLILIMMMTLIMAFSACSEKKAREMYETAEFEELQKNFVHARKLYQEIIEKYPNTEYSRKASSRS